MIFGDLGPIDNPGREHLQAFVARVEEFLGIVVNNVENEFGFLWRNRPQLQALARATFEEDVRRSAEELRAAILEIPQERINRHGLEGRPLAFKLGVLASISDQWGAVRATIALPEWLRRIIDAIDALLDSLIDAAGGAGSLVKEFKDALAALIPTRS